MKRKKKRKKKTNKREKYNEWWGRREEEEEGGGEDRKGKNEKRAIRGKMQGKPSPAMHGSLLPYECALSACMAGLFRTFHCQRKSMSIMSHESLPWLYAHPCCFEYLLPLHEQRTENFSCSFSVAI
jgi:hypothetical protein